MAFWGHTFIFDGVACSDFGLMVYDFGSNGQSDVVYQGGAVIEDRLQSRYDSLMYGLEHNQALEYTLVFGANPAALDVRDSIDRYEVEAITAWLTGHQQRKWLTIVQDDMESYRYKCVITDLQLITYGNMPWAFSCKVSCDSPFAYTFPEVYRYDVNGEKTIRFFNRSSRNGYFCPELTIQMRGGTTDISIQNDSDNGRTFAFTGMPGGNEKLYIDNHNRVIESSTGTNFYKYFNMKFLRLVRGDNVLKIKGNAQIELTCEFPVSIGG